MITTLFGPADSWSLENRCKLEYLMEKYCVREEIMLPSVAENTMEITGDEAVRIIREAVCLAWNMPEDAMDSWTGIAQLTQMDTDKGGIAFYRVFLTRPDSELDQNTFGGKDNFNYRVSLDGTILDSSVSPSWRSPADDVVK